MGLLQVRTTTSDLSVFLLSFVVEQEQLLPVSLVVVPSGIDIPKDSWFTGKHCRCGGKSVCLFVCLFLTFSVLVANPKKLLYTVANPARGLLNREKRTKEKVWQHTTPHPPHCPSEKINKITRRIYRRYAGGRSRVLTRIPSARRLGLWVWLRKILHSRLR